jgi:hypothetical protein
MTKFEPNENVRVVGEKRGSYNEFARVVEIMEDGRYWIANMNMPYQGTISAIVCEDKIAKIEEK